MRASSVSRSKTTLWSLTQPSGKNRIMCLYLILRPDLTYLTSSSSCSQKTTVLGSCLPPMTSSFSHKVESTWSTCPQRKEETSKTSKAKLDFCIRLELLTSWRLKRQITFCLTCAIMMTESWLFKNNSLTQTDWPSSQPSSQSRSLSQHWESSCFCSHSTSCPNNQWWKIWWKPNRRQPFSSRCFWSSAWRACCLTLLSIRRVWESCLMIRTKAFSTTSSHWSSKTFQVRRQSTLLLSPTSSFL